MSQIVVSYSLSNVKSYFRISLTSQYYAFHSRVLNTITLLSYSQAFDTTTVQSPVARSAGLRSTWPCVNMAARCDSGPGSNATTWPPGRVALKLPFLGKPRNTIRSTNRFGSAKTPAGVPGAAGAVLATNLPPE
mmetsp:Transcript_9107/g.15888  ORF Transcript_9107/g.15888 Transcript_9107/m.15888 type:complete len:134 (-) Transcript_9107:2458-2859(-)